PATYSLFPYTTLFRSLPRRLGHVLRAARRTGRCAPCRKRRRERDVRLPQGLGAVGSRRRPQLALTERIEPPCLSGTKCCWEAEGDRKSTRLNSSHVEM